MLLSPQDNPAIGPGIGVAAPGLNGELDAIGYSCGTSNSTALAARSLSQIYDVLEGLQDASDQYPFPGEPYHAVLAKTLLVHASGWHEDLSRLSMLLGLSGRDRRRELTRILGYGAVRQERAMSAENKRVVLIGAGSIVKDQRNTFHFPLPAEMSASTEWRRLTITLGWLSPINVHSQKYRMGRLRFTASNEDIGVRPTEADPNAVLKGTVQHQVFEGVEAAGYIDGSTLSIDVDCRVDGGKLTAGIKYGLAASLEVGPSIRSDIHDDVRSRLSQQVPVPTRVHVR